LSLLWTSCDCLLLIDRSITTDANPSIHVILSDDLLSYLRRVAQENHDSLRWLVAGLVCDTFESGIERSENQHVTATGR
jgi:hypothetical protein